MSNIIYDEFLLLNKKYEEIIELNFCDNSISKEVHLKPDDFDSISIKKGLKPRKNEKWYHRFDKRKF